MGFAALRGGARLLTLLRASASLLLLALLAIVVGCPPPQADCNNGTGQCPAGEIVICSGVCARPLPYGAPCSDDPCSPAGACGPGLSCAPNHTCRNARLLGESCPDPGQPGWPCTSGDYCRDPKCAPVPQPPTCAAPHGPSLTTGDTCDSDYSSPACSPCDPGTHCINAPPSKTCSSPTCNNYCRKACDPNNGGSDCPCGFTCPGQSPKGIDGVSLPADYCYMCRDLTQACDDLNPCCDGSTCSGGTCCLLNNATCDVSHGNGDCCGGQHCYQAVSSGPATCQVCKAPGQVCLTDNDCCSNTCQGGYCRSTTGTCTEDLDCPVGQTCNCGVCANPTALGTACAPNAAASCLCAKTDQQAMCGPVFGGSDVCCVPTCHVCKTVQDCCLTGTTGEMQCQQTAFNGPMLCCAGLGASCGGPGDCCNGTSCQGGTCKSDSTGNAACSGGVQGCSPLGYACGASLGCCSPNVCNAGTCSAPGSYHLVSYLVNFYDQIDTSSVFDYTITSGTPVAVSALSQAYIITHSPDTILGVKFSLGPPATALGLGPLPLPVTPYSLDTFYPYPPTTVDSDVVIGGGGDARLFSIAGGAIKLSTVDSKTIAGDVIGASPAMPFDSSGPSGEEAFVTTAGKLYDIDFTATPPHISGTVDLPASGYGNPVGVDFGEDGTVWAITDAGWLVAYMSPGLNGALPLTGQMTFAGPPVAVAGGKSVSGTTGDLVVATAGDSSHSSALNIFHGGNAKDLNRLTYPLADYTVPSTAVPVGLRVTDDATEELAWVVIRNPNKLLLVNASTATLISTVGLPGVPIAINMGYQPSWTPSQGGFWANPHASAMFVHILVAEP